MIHTVFCDSANADLPPELLSYSWGRARQPGELVRLVGGRASQPAHRLGRDITTACWSPHPYTGDVYAPYQMPASLLEWLFVERVEGTVLLLESTSVFHAPVSSEVTRGQAQGTAWRDIPRGDGPFGLGPEFEFLAKFCVNRALDLPAVTLPLLIHTTDLRKIVPRWLELMSIIRAETASRTQGPVPDANRIAYVIAAAEAGIAHTTASLSVTTDAPQSLLAEFLERRSQGLDLAFVKPRRHTAVREGKILGSVFLEIPGRADTVSLNSSGAAIWEVCDGIRSLAEINHALEARFEMPPGSLRADVEVVIQRLERIGALRLEPV